MLNFFEKISDKKQIIMISLLFLPLFTFFLGIPSFWDEDESIYAEISRQMVLRNDFIGTYFNYQPRFDKPPLNFWINIFFYKIFGMSEFTSRLGSMLFGLAGLILIYLFGKRLFNRRSGLLAALILGTSFLYYIETQLAIIDTTLTFFITLTVYWFYRGFYENKPQFLLLLGIPLGLGILAKGPVALALSGAIAFCFWLFCGITKTRDWRSLFNRQLAAGFLIALLIAVPWYYAMWSRYGMDFIQNHFGYHMFERFTRPLEQHGGAWYFNLYYGVILFIGMLPWSFSLLGAITLGWKRWKEPSVFLLNIWFLLVFAFFSLAQTKLPGYALPFFPPAALLVGMWWDQFISGAKGRALLTWGKGIQFIVALLFIVLLASQRSRLPIEYRESIWILFLLPLILLLGSLATLIVNRLHNKNEPFFNITFVTFYLFWVFFMVVLVPLIENDKPVKYLAAELKPYLNPEDRVISFIPGTKGAPYYTKHPVIYVTNNTRLTELLQENKTTYALVRKKSIKYLTKENIQFHQIAKHGTGYLISNQPVK